VTVATFSGSYGADPAELYGDLHALLERPAWQAQARCRGFGTDSFFTEGGASQHAKAVCSPCPVRTECAEAGMGEVGVWGGMSERERRRLARESA
jgi:hypothetical protein